MEGAPLRPVPLRPAGPVDAAAALAHVASLLPRLDEPAQRALALVDLGGEDRATAAMRLGLDIPKTAAALARARKALRRSMFSLPATGWCERAEILISDRMDGELSAAGTHRLESHLSNCDRCQEHELRLAQALDTLGRTFAVSAPPPTPQLAPPAPEAQRPPEAQRVAFTPPQLVVVEPVEPPAPVPAAEAPPAQPSAQTIDAAAEIVTRQLGFRAATWHFLFLMAVLLAVAVVIVTALALSGVDRVL